MPTAASAVYHQVLGCTHNRHTFCELPCFFRQFACLATPMARRWKPRLEDVMPWQTQAARPQATCGPRRNVMRTREACSMKEECLFVVRCRCTYAFPASARGAAECRTTAPWFNSLVTPPICRIFCLVLKEEHSLVSKIFHMLPLQQRPVPEVLLNISAFCLTMSRAPSCCQLRSPPHVTLLHPQVSCRRLEASVRLFLFVLHHSSSDGAAFTAFGAARLRHAGPMAKWPTRQV